MTGDDDGSIAEFLCDLLPYHAEAARAHGLDLVMYEGGSHLAGVGPWAEDAELTAFFTHLSYAPEMGELYRAAAERLGGGRRRRAFNAYRRRGAPRAGGAAGARLRHLDDANPRWDGPARAAGARRRLPPDAGVTRARGHPRPPPTEARGQCSA